MHVEKSSSIIQSEIPTKRGIPMHLEVLNTNTCIKMNTVNETAAQLSVRLSAF